MVGYDSAFMKSETASNLNKIGTIDSRSSTSSFSGIKVWSLESVDLRVHSFTLPKAGWSWRTDLIIIKQLFQRVSTNVIILQYATEIKN